MPVLVSSPRFVGRREELGVLEDALARAEHGEGSAVLVSGESGMGKSRLIGRLVATARDRGEIVMVGECVEFAEGELPYAPIGGALRSLLHEPATIVESDDLGVERLLAELTPGSSSRGEEAPSAIAQARLFERLVAMLFDLCRQAPAVVLVIEDLHWADRSTGDFISFLVRNARRQRLLLIISYRSDELDRRHPLRPLVLELERSGRASRIGLRPFSRQELTEQVAAIIDGAPESSLIDRLTKRAEGNPFFAEELLAASLSPGAALPESVRDALMLRVEACSEDTQTVLRVAAVAGRTVDHALLAAVAGLPEDELMTALDEAVSRHMLVQDPSSSSFSFRHALLREAVYADLLPGRRRSLHVALAHALTEQPELSGPHGGATAEVAHHWYAARELGEALIASIRAGEEADAVHAHAEALLHYSRALELWNDTAPAKPSIDRLELNRRAADAANLSGDYERAIARARNALDLVHEEEDPVTAGVIRERLGRFLWIAGREEEALIAYRRAVELMPADPPSQQRALVLAAEGQALMLAGRTAESARRCEEAIELATRVGAQAAEANALNTLVIKSTGEGDYERAVQTAARAREIARRLGAAEEVGRSYVNGSDALDQGGRVAESIALAQEGVELARTLGIDRAFGDFLRADMLGRLIRTGSWVDADKLLLEFSERAPTGLAQALLHENRGLLAAERGQFDSAARDIAEAEKLFSGMRAAMWRGPLGAARATMQLWMHRPDQAAATIREGVAEGVTQAEESGLTFFTARLYDLGARAAADIADSTPSEQARQRVGAQALLQRFDCLLEQVKHRAPPYALASRAACAAEASRIGCADPAPWANAQRLWEQAGDRYQAAYARFREAEALIASAGNAGEASDLLHDAHSVSVELSAGPLRAHVEGLARRSGIALDDGLPTSKPLAQARLASPNELSALQSGVAAVLFSDIEDSTLLLDSLGDELFMDLLAEHNRLVREQITRHNGREIKTAGDSFMVAFAQPRRALACAVAIQRATSEIKPPIRLRIGLHAGETLYQEDDLFGRHVVIAARVAALAIGGQILVTSLIRELAEGATGLHFGARREHSFKGLSGTHSVFPLHWDPES
jgi:class 3 adenylate cyclase/tetratricopeptide (TPR) repeat protein